MEDLDLKIDERLESLLLEGMDSGEPLIFTDEVLEAIRQSLQQRLAKSLK